MEEISEGQNNGSTVISYYSYCSGKKSPLKASAHNVEKKQDVIVTWFQRSLIIKQ